MPFVPVALIVLINDSANGDERMGTVDALGSDLKGGTVWGQICDLTHLLKVNIRTHQNGLAVFTDRLHAGRPAEGDLSAAVGTIRGRLRHWLRSSSPTTAASDSTAYSRAILRT